MCSPTCVCSGCYACESEVLSAFLAFAIYRCLVNTRSVAEHSLQHCRAINKIKELHVDTHINHRETERRTRVFHRLSEFQFVLVKMERISAQDIRAGQSGAGSVHGWLSAHRCGFMSGSAEIHLLPVRLKPQNRLSPLRAQPHKLKGLLKSGCKKW